MYKNIMTTFLLCVLIIVILVGCDPLEKDIMNFYQSTESIDLSQENINSISISSNKNDILEAFGIPNQVEEVENPKSQYLIYDGIEFGLIEEKVNRYYIQENYETTKGIVIGDSKDRVIKEYGQNYYERVESNIETLGYFDKDHMINIEFGIHENKVVAVIVEKIDKKR
ncbi:hypothetical protein [Piscibacillus halophilus]|uniref:Uncharacterized protein n=2 Tax=Piscibacillus halophilus TaxID=571933 RepID=A0A1H9IW61_9BACI|nr:hypothetical protein [Piscibacillus halophilus]SEQ78769.1 hypothetical protein SAMN05216362_12721 [Piscibacillus halophilus]